MPFMCRDSFGVPLINASSHTSLTSKMTSLIRTAAALCVGVNRTFLLLIASPSASRASGTPATSTAKSRSRAIRRTNRHCW